MVGAGQEARDAARALKSAAEVVASSVGDGWEIAAIALLHDQEAIVNVTGFTAERPIANRREPREFAADAAAHFAIVNKLGFPGGWLCDANELVFVIVFEDPGAV